MFSRFRALPTTVPVLATLVMASACNQPAETPAESTTVAPESMMKPVVSGWVTTEGIETPESVFVDSESGFIFASQIVGAPDGRDGDGRIVKLAGDGSVVDAMWVTGLNAPKGLRGCQGTLWTADLDEVIGIDIESGSISSRVTVPDAQFLNDVACGPDGTVYVSDMFANRIHAIQGDTLSLFAEGEQLEWPNGLLVEGSQLVVGGWGQPGADFTTEVPGRLFTLDLATKEKTLITPEPFANIDGVESDGRGGYIITDWVAGKVLQVGGDGEVRELRTFEPGTADHAFLPEGNVLILPHMSENRIGAYDLSDALP